MRPDADDSSLYDIAPDRPADPPIAKKAGAVAPVPVMPYHGKARGQPEIDPEILRNQWMPLWLLGAGVAIEVAAAFLRRPNIKVALTEIATQLVLGTAVMLGGVLIAAKFRGIQLGNFWSAVLKLAAICIAPSAAVTLAWPILQYIPLVGGLTAWLGQFVLYFALLGALFDLDESDTWYCVAVIFIVGVAMHFATIAIVGIH